MHRTTECCKSRKSDFQWMWLFNQTNCIRVRFHHGWEDFPITVFHQGNSARSSRQPSLVVKVKVRVRRWGRGWRQAPTVENPCPRKSPTWTMCRASRITWCSLISSPASHMHRARLRLFLVFGACRFLWFGCWCKAGCHSYREALLMMSRAVVCPCAKCGMRLVVLVTWARRRLWRDSRVMFSSSLRSRLIAGICWMAIRARVRGNSTAERVLTYAVFTEVTPVKFKNKDAKL